MTETEGMTEGWREAHSGEPLTKHERVIDALGLQR